MTSVRALVSRAILRARGIPLLDDELNSEKLRRHYAEHHGITVGLYSYGCFSAARINPNTTIGRYCSFANTANVFNRNHGTQFLSTTAYLYNARLGVVEEDTIVYDSCDIGDDVWVGHNAIILPKARKIGRGAVIAAGAVVTRDVPPYAIVAGNPAKVVGYRFEPEVIERIEATQWWMWTPDRIRAELSTHPELFFQPPSAFAQGVFAR